MSPPVASAPPDAVSGVRRPAALGVVLAGVAALGLRGAVMASSLSAPDADEAVVALIGQRLTRGYVDVMFWGQGYGGTIESFLSAPLFAVFGPHLFVQRVLLLAITSLCVLLTWRVGRRLVGEPAAAIGAALFAVCSPYFVWLSMKMNIYYGALTLSLVVLLLLLRLRDDDAPRWWPVAFGLASGAAFWSNPQTAFVLVPAAVVWVRALLMNIRRVLLAVPFAVVGASPWLIFSIRNDWSTLEVPGVDVYLPYGERVLLFFQQLPIVLGFRMPFTQAWLLPKPVWVAVAIGATVAAAWACVRGWRGVAASVALVVGYAILFGVSPQVGQPGVNLQPRYLLFVVPILCLLVAALATSLRWQRLPVLGVLVVIVASGCAAVGLTRMASDGSTLASGGPGAVVPADLSDLEYLLAEHDVQYAYSFYWLAYRATLETDEEVIVTPAFAHVSRFRPYADAAAESKAPAWIAIRDEAQVAALQRRLETLGVPFELVERGRFAVFLPVRNVDREELATAFREAGIFA